MEMKNSNPNGHNFVINNLHPIFFLFSKILKIKLNGRLQKFILVKRFHNYPQTKIPRNFHLVNQNGMIQSFPCIHYS